MPSPIVHDLLIAAALAAFAWIVARRLALLRRAAPDPRTDRPGARVARLLKIGFGQSRQPRYPVAGTLHVLIFAGFLVLSLRSLTLLGEGFVAGFTLPGFGGAGGRVYAVIKDWTALVVLVCCVVAGVRRAAWQPARYHDRLAKRPHGAEAYVILALIAVLMVADAFYEGAALTTSRPAALPLATAARAALAGATPELRDTVGLAGFWVHDVTLLFFLCYLPLSKHFHVLTALPNVYLSNLRPGGAVKPPRYGVTDLDELDAIGAAHLEDFTWKHVLDFYSCTDCGRCSDHCPAYAAGTPLSPRMISIACRDAAYSAYPVRAKAAPEEPTPLEGVVDPAAVWACTTCGACEEACPVTIEYIDKIVDLRRNFVDAGEVPPSIQKALAAIEKQGNPFGKPPRTRGDWVRDEDGAECGVRLLGRDESADTLFFTDSCAAYDPRIQRTARAFARILAAAGRDVGTLGPDEVDSGNEVRRMGEEGLFELLRDGTRDAFAARRFDSVVTTDPHAMNALRHDHGLDVPVRHHSEVIAELLGAGAVRVAGNGADRRVHVFHDPCYLGRHNGVYDAPRHVLQALGVRTVEMERSRNRSFCCGGGSLHLFHESEGETRMADLRIEQAVAAGAEVVVTACPFCLLNLEDAVNTAGRGGSVEVVDLAELVDRHLETTSD